MARVKPTQALQERLRRLIEKGEAVLAIHHPNPPNVIGFPTLDTQVFNEWRAQSLALLHELLGSEHTSTRMSYRTGRRKGIPSLR